MRRGAGVSRSALAGAVLAGLALAGMALAGCGDATGVAPTRSALEESFPGRAFSVETSMDGFTTVLWVGVRLDGEPLDAQELAEIVTVATDNAGRAVGRLEVAAIGNGQDLAPLARKLGFPDHAYKPDDLVCTLDLCRQVLGLR